MPGDFVEAPSQMLENWVWDKKVLDSFAADYRDPSKKIPPEILGQLKAAKYATYGCSLSPAAFVRVDGSLPAHADHRRRTHTEAMPLANQTLSETFLPVPEDTAMIAYLGHFTGYDAGYYGYAWADAIAADMATVFEKSPDGFFDQPTGPAVARGDLCRGQLARREHLHREVSGPPAFHRAVSENRSAVEKP